MAVALGISPTTFLFSFRYEFVKNKRRNIFQFLRSLPSGNKAFELLFQNRLCKLNVLCLFLYSLDCLSNLFSVVSGGICLVYASLTPSFIDYCFF